jgi:hypothetical protein
MCKNCQEKYPIYKERADKLKKKRGRKGRDLVGDIQFTVLACLDEYNTPDDGTFQAYIDIVCSITGSSEEHVCDSFVWFGIDPWDGK